MNNEVTAVVSLRDNHFQTLPLLLFSLINQTVKPKKLLIFDDGEEKDLRGFYIFSYLFSLLQNNNIEWEVVYGEKNGHFLNYNKALKIVKTEWIWHLREGHCPEHCALQKMIEHIDDSVGAVGGEVIDSDKSSEEKYLNSLNTSFIFRVRSVPYGYCGFVSPYSLNIECILSHEIWRSGWRLIYDPSIRVWNMKEKYSDKFYYDCMKNDNRVLEDKKDIWKLLDPESKLVVLDCGIGDHIAFLMVLPDLLVKYPKIVLSVCYPYLFENFNLPLISIGQSKILTNDQLDKYNVYKWMIDKRWKDKLFKAFKSMYEELFG